MIHAIATWWAGVAPNLESNVIWGAPVFVIHHKLLRRHITNTARQQQANPAPKEPPACP